jgi:hypothetical protein
VAESVAVPGPLFPGWPQAEQNFSSACCQGGMAALHINNTTCSLSWDHAPPRVCARLRASADCVLRDSTAAVCTQAMSVRFSDIHRGDIRKAALLIFRGAPPTRGGGLGLSVAQSRWCSWGRLGCAVQGIASRWRLLYFKNK